MGYGTDGLTFNTLRSANRQRLLEFKNPQGAFIHFDKDGSNWPLSKWMNALVGEVGEAANIIKKIERGDFTPEELLLAKKHLADELADVVTYLDLLANRAGINLGEATMLKWDEVSKRVGCDMYLDVDDWHRHKSE